MIGDAPLPSKASPSRRAQGPHSRVPGLRPPKNVTPCDIVVQSFSQKATCEDRTICRNHSSWFVLLVWKQGSCCAERPWGVRISNREWLYAFVRRDISATEQSSLVFFEITFTKVASSCLFISSGGSSLFAAMSLWQADARDWFLLSNREDSGPSDIMINPVVFFETVSNFPLKPLAKFWASLEVMKCVSLANSPLSGMLITFMRRSPRCSISAPITPSPRCIEKY